MGPAASNTGIGGNQDAQDMNIWLIITPRFRSLEDVFCGDRSGLQTALDQLLLILGGRPTTSYTIDWLENLQDFNNILALHQTIT